MQAENAWIVAEHGEEVALPSDCRGPNIRIRLLLGVPVVPPDTQGCGRDSYKDTAGAVVNRRIVSIVALLLLAALGH